MKKRYNCSECKKCEPVLRPIAYKIRLMMFYRLFDAAINKYMEKEKIMGKPSRLEMSYLEKVRNLRHESPMIKAAYNSGLSEIEVLSLAVIGLSEQNERLRKQLEKEILNTMPLILEE